MPNRALLAGLPSLQARNGVNLDSCLYGALFPQLSALAQRGVNKRFDGSRRIRRCQLPLFLN